LDKLLSDDQPGSADGASTGKEPTQPVSKDVKTSEPSERENARVRELVEENKTLKQQLSEKDKPVESNGAPTPGAQTTDIDQFLNQSVADEGSRKVLRQLADILTKGIESKYAPKLSQVERFTAQQEFSALKAKVPALAAYESEVLKTLQNNPGKSVKTVVGEILVERALTKITPTETAGSQTSREPVTTDDMSLDEMYDLIGAK
jgi:hypothetical protein